MPPLPSARRSKADSGRGTTDDLNPHSRYYLLEYAKKQITEKHEKPVLDEYHEDLNALRQAGVMDRSSLEDTARVKFQARLNAVQPATAAEFKALEDLIISEYEPLVRKHLIDEAKNRLATLKRDNASRARRQPVRFTRAEVAEAGEVWKAK